MHRTLVSFAKKKAAAGFSNVGARLGNHAVASPSSSSSSSLLPLVKVPHYLVPSLAGGHPWIYRKHVNKIEIQGSPSTTSKLKCGQWVQVQPEGGGKTTAYALYDSLSQIALRVYSHKNVPDYDWVKARVQEAWNLRRSIRNDPLKTTAYRWMFGEGDYLPGITVDLYGPYAVLMTYAKSVDTLVPWVTKAMVETINGATTTNTDADVDGNGNEFRLKGILRRHKLRSIRKEENEQKNSNSNSNNNKNSRNKRQQQEDDEAEDEAFGDESDVGEMRELSGDKVTLLWGEAPPCDKDDDGLIVEEKGIKFKANLYKGQKSGLFLDQRENRFALEHFAKGKKRLLNLYSYTSAFSIYACRGEPSLKTTNVDIAPMAAKDAQENFRLNGLDPAQHEFVVSDVFKFVEKRLATFYSTKQQQQQQQQQQGNGNSNSNNNRSRSGGSGGGSSSESESSLLYDIVVCDPPSFSRNKESKEQALKAYIRVHALGMMITEHAGLYVASSCTSNITPQDFRDCLEAAARQAGKRYQVIYEAGQPSDHPVSASHSEGRYLKFIVGRILDKC